MNINDLRKYFISFNKEFVEGEVLKIKEVVNLTKKIKSAHMYSTCLGLYEVLVNGNKIDEQLFKPGLTYYHKRLLVQEIDLTKSLKKDNTIEFLIGQGWYSGRYYCENTVQNFGDVSAISYMIIFTYEDDSEEIITSKKDMDVYQTVYDYAGLYDGEVVDFRKSEKVILKTSPYTLKEDIRLDKTLTKVVKNEELNVVSIIENENNTILDFGQNHAGIVSIDLSKIPDNTTITLRHGEILNKDNTLYTANLRKAKAQIIITKTNQTNIYEPIFTYMGFRYIELTGVKYVDGLIKSHSIYTKMERTGYFSSSNKNVERLYLNQLWSMRSNYIEVPTDCPQRDERMGYTGDAQVFTKTASYNYNIRDFYKNFFEDIRLNQLDTPDRNVSPFVPDKGPHPVGFMSMQGWGSAVSIIPEVLRTTYNDYTLLDEYYDMLKDYVDLEISKSKNNLWCAISLGDWLSLGKGVAWQAMNNHAVSNAFFVHDLKVLKESAKRLNKLEDYEYYNKQYNLTHDAYIRKFIKKNGLMKKDYQGSYSVCLQYVLEDSDSVKPLVYNKFIENVKKNGLATGFFGTANLLPLICDGGYEKLAVDVLLSEKCPGWMYQIQRGATTIWERWDSLKEDGFVNETKMSDDNMVSFNHYSFGAVGRFYYEYLLGIKPLEEGFKKVLIKPVIDRRINGVKGSINTINGLVESSWKYDKDTVTFNITVPVSSTIILPNKETYEVTKGSYEYIIKVEE